MLTVKVRVRQDQQDEKNMNMVGGGGHRLGLEDRKKPKSNPFEVDGKT